MIKDGDLRRALEKIMRRGADTRNGRLPGMRDMMDRLRQMRQQELQRYDMGSVLDDIEQQLEAIVDQERTASRSGSTTCSTAVTTSGNRGGHRSGTQTIRAKGKIVSRPRGARALNSRHRPHKGSADENGQQTPGGQSASPANGSSQTPKSAGCWKTSLNRKNRFLDDLPKDAGGQIRSLQDYEFMDPTARQMFQDLISKLQQQMLGNTFEGMMQGMQNMTPEDMAGIREMVRDLNEMLERQRARRRPAVRAVHAEARAVFPPGIKQRGGVNRTSCQADGANANILNSMTPEQRAQFSSVMDALLRDDRLQFDLMRLGNNLGQLFPMDADGFGFSGEESLGMGEALDVMGRMQRMDDLEADLRGAQSIGDLDKIDRDELRDLLGEDAAQSMDQLQQLAKMLEDAGYLQRRGSKLELTPRGLRKIGQKALTDIFQQMKQDRVGKHETDRRGAGGERTDETKRTSSATPSRSTYEKR